jgi:hypothetical protein
MVDGFRNNFLQYNTIQFLFKIVWLAGFRKKRLQATPYILF